MTKDERKELIRGFVGSIRTVLFVISVIEAQCGELVQAGFLLIVLSIVNVFYNGLPFTIFWGLCGFGILLLGYGKSFFAFVPLALAFVILAADIILWIRAIKREGMRGLLRMKITADRPKIYARRDFYKDNEITCILWNKLTKNRIEAKSAINDVGDVPETGITMTNDDRKKFIKFILTESILLLLFMLGVVCLLFEKLVWTGILLIIVGVVSTFFLGLPVSSIIFIGLMLIFLGYERKELGLFFGVIGVILSTANVILWHKSIANGWLERVRMFAKSNRFAILDHLRENEITFILWDKLKRRLNWTKTGKNNQEGE